MIPRFRAYGTRKVVLLLKRWGEQGAGSEEVGGHYLFWAMALGCGTLELREKPGQEIEI